MAALRAAFPIGISCLFSAWPKAGQRPSAPPGGRYASTRGRTLPLAFYSTLTCGLLRFAAGWMISSCKAQTSASTLSGEPLPR